MIQALFTSNWQGYARSTIITNVLAWYASEATIHEIILHCTTVPNAVQSCLSASGVLQPELLINSSRILAKQAVDVWKPLLISYWSLTSVFVPVAGFVARSFTVLPMSRFQKIGRDRWGLKMTETIKILSSSMISRCPLYLALHTISSLCAFYTTNL